jgi:hypothetical protein
MEEMMSDRPIQVGDLVQVVRGTPCCGHISIWGGHIFTVAEILSVGGDGQCAYCDVLRSFSALAFPKIAAMEGIELVMLKRIPPLGELNEVPTDAQTEREVAA